MSGDRLVIIAKCLLYFVGLWTLHLKNDNVYTKIYRIYSICIKIVYLSFVTTLVTQYVILLRRHDNLERLISSLAIVIIIVENATKCVLFHTNKIPYMFQDIVRNEKEVFASGDKRIIKQYMSQVKFCRRINIFQIIAIVSAIGNFAYITFVEYSSKGLEAFRDKAFMHDIWYPFEWERHMNVVIFLQMYYLIIGGSINVASLTTLVVLISYGAIKLRLLQIKIKDIKNNSHETQVKNLLKEHQYIISFMHSLNEKTKYVMLMEFCLNSINLAIAVMQGLMAKDLASLAYSASLLFLVVLQVFIIAWVSNDIKIQSLAIGDAIYNCKWYGQSRSIRDLLRLVIVRAQTPLLLTIGPFGPMTNETALTMVKAAYTYLTVMRNFYK